MPMLAEPKRKTKWSLNPRGTLWSNDENKFGQKMLEKMGWSKGKGLGREEQGCTDPIKVTNKDDNKGIGFKGNPDQTAAHYDAYEDVLSHLNSMNEDPSERAASKSDPSSGSATPGLPDSGESSDDDAKGRKSLERVSRNSRARVHYQKFTRGKDTSRYNEDDLACILGSKRSKKGKKDSADTGNATHGAESSPDDAENTDLTCDKNETLNQSQKLINAGDLKNYFAKKMSEIKRKREEGILAQGQKDFNLEESCYQIPNLEFTPMKKDFSFNYTADFDKTSTGFPKDDEPTKEAEKPKEKKRKRGDKIKEGELGQDAEKEVVGETQKRKKRKKDKRKEELMQFIDECHNEIESQRKEKARKDQPDMMQEDSEGMELENKRNEVFLQRYSSQDQPSKKKKKKRKRADSPSQSDERNDLNDSYYAAANKEERRSKKSKPECQKQLDESLLDQPLKKLKKFTSDLSIGDLFKSKEVTTERAEDDGDAKCKRKLKLSAKGSFRSLVDLGEKLKTKYKTKNGVPGTTMKPLQEACEEEAKQVEDKENNIEYEECEQTVKKKREREDLASGEASRPNSEEAAPITAGKKKKKMKKGSPEPCEEEVSSSKGKVRSFRVSKSYVDLHGQTSKNSIDLDVSHLFKNSNLDDIEAYPL